MFKKLLSNLPFNPSLIGQVAFYAKRLRRESALRRAGLIAMSLALVLQVFAVFSPPQPSMASSNNDMIVGGIQSKQDAVDACTQNNRYFGTISKYFGITCTDIKNASTVQVRSDALGGKLTSLGWNSYDMKQRTPISVPGVPAPLFWSNLTVWDTGPYSTYTMLQGKTASGKVFYIMYRCGNLVFIGQPVPQDVCTNLPGLQTKPEECDVCPNKAGIQTTTGQCDVCPLKTGVQTTPTACDVCPNKTGTQTTASQCDMCPLKTGVQTTTIECDVCPNITGVQTSTSQCDVCSNIPGEQSNTVECKPCEESQTRTDLTSCLVFHKTASNPTQGITDANGTVAKAGDTVEYTLTTTNKGKVTIKGYIVTEGMSDVLDYADIVSLNGGSKDQFGLVSWSPIDIKAGQTITNKVTVKIKNPIPQTPISSSDSEHFNMVMTNVYGDSVNIKLPPTVVKATEIITTTVLPNTGPGTSLTIACLTTVLIGYFFARSRLLTKELDIVRADFGGAGGY